MHTNPTTTTIATNTLNDAPRPSPLAPSLLYPAHLPIGLYAISLEALERVELPAFAAATLRGAFGWAFKRLVCYQPQVKSCQGCLLRTQCAYPPIFEPQPSAATLYADLQNVPAPYVLRPPADEQRVYAPGELITFELVLIGQAVAALPYFAVALQQLQQQGLGRSRGRVRVAHIAALPPASVSSAPVPLYDQAEPALIHNHPGWPAAAWVTASPAPPQVDVEFLTLTRLRSENQLQTAPDFHVFYRALLRRASALSTYHSSAPWQTDFAGLAQAARQVQTVALALHEGQERRYSRRQERPMELWGCQGRATYAGDLTPFWPLLQLGQVLHVGKSCTFGLGRYRLCEE